MNYTTRDMYEVIYLLCLRSLREIELINYDWRDGSLWFAFSPGETARQALFNMMNLKVDPIQPKLMLLATREFKNLIRSAQR